FGCGAAAASLADAAPTQTEPPTSEPPTTATTEPTTTPPATTTTTPPSTTTATDPASTETTTSGEGTTTTAPTSTATPSASPRSGAPRHVLPRQPGDVRSARPHRKKRRHRGSKPLTVTPALGLDKYVFPVVGVAGYGDSYGAFRGDVHGKWHHGDDIFAPLGS